MRGTKFTHVLVVIVMLCTAFITSCRKDESLDSFLDEKTDTTTVTTSLGSFLATDGKLKVTWEDTTYVFDAEVDSIAFVKVDTAGNQYFGVTAINKEHNISFGISGVGAAENKAKTTVAGGQLLFQLSKEKAASYTLSREAHKLDSGKFNLKKYAEEDDEVQAKGNFTTYLVHYADKDSVLHKVTGTFDLKFK
ncbi:MAG: hypothetical protein EOP46_05100 [Sphingobacteriaceae bacterium]|nr:MAG: hypothetical protein EOP46_05100 [Sphingobacteriaceae bacterium]